MVYAIHRTDEVVPQSTTETPAQADSTGQKPGGTPPEVQSTTVTVRTIDQKVQWITVEGDVGTTTAFWVGKKIPANVNAGDRVVVRYEVGEVLSAKLSRRANSKTRTIERETLQPFWQVGVRWRRTPHRSK